MPIYIISATARTILLVTTDFAMLPALQIMAKNRRHFELFIGSLLIASKTMYNLCQALAFDVIIEEIEWHFISDVAALSFFILLLIHISSPKSENHNIAMRYLAFSFAWVAKYRDGWDSITSQAIVVLISFILAGMSISMSIPKINFSDLTFGSVAASCAVLLYVFINSIDPYHLFKYIVFGGINVLSGISMFYLYRMVPCRRFKNEDSILGNDDYMGYS